MIINLIENNKLYKIKSIQSKESIASYISVIPENDVKKIFLDLLVGQNNLIHIKVNEIIYVLNYNPPFLEFIYKSKFIKTSSFFCSIDMISLEKLS